MTWQAFVVPDYLSMGRGVHIYLGLKRPDGSMTATWPMLCSMRSQRTTAARRIFGGCGPTTTPSGAGWTR